MLFRLLRTVKFSHTIFSLPYALIAAVITASSWYGLDKCFLIIWCMVWGHAAAMMFNRIADVEFDRRNPRTAHRRLPTGRITPQAATRFLGVASCLFTMGAVLFWKPIGPWFGYGNYWPAILALPALFFLCAYSVTKRLTMLSHFWLGIAIGLSPLAAAVALNGLDIPNAVYMLAVAVTFWVAGFDIIYACQDIDIDREQGLYSIPAQLGPQRALAISRGCHAVTVIALLLVGQLAHLGILWWAAVTLSAFLLIIEHRLIILNRTKFMRLSFEGINGIISLILTAAAYLDILICNHP